MTSHGQSSSCYDRNGCFDSVVLDSIKIVSNLLLSGSVVAADHPFDTMGVLG